MKVVVDPGVWKDANDAIDYYAVVEPSLTGSFIDEVWAALAFIESYPQAGRVLISQYRRVALRHFPYLVCYLISDGTVQVLAVIHNRRGPRWVRMHLDSRV